MIIAALLFVAQVAPAETVATCRERGDPSERVYSLERGPQDSWRVVFQARTIDKPRVELPLPNVTPTITEREIDVRHASANGGLTINWSIHFDDKHLSSLQLYVNHGLEVNVQRDLDPAVDQMSTEDRIVVQCTRGTGSSPVEWMAAGGVARSVSLYQSQAGRAYAVLTIGWARELTRELSLGPIRGRFAWGVEATPLFAQFDPSRIYGLGFAPVVWRWNFPPRPRWSAFAELSMGGLLTDEPIPDKTSRGNFSAHWGGGLRVRPRGAHAILIAYRFQHFSNGNQLGSNPGVNSHVVLAGWSHRR